MNVIMGKSIKIIIWFSLFFIGIFISYLRIGEFRDLSFSMSMGQVFVVFCAIPSFISSGIHYLLSGKKTSENEILDDKGKVEKNYWDIFYHHLMVVSILVAVWKYFRPLLDYEIS